MTQLEETMTRQLPDPSPAEQTALDQMLAADLDLYNDDGPYVDDAADSLLPEDTEPHLRLLLSRILLTMDDLISGGALVPTDENLPVMNQLGRLMETARHELIWGAA